MLCVFANASKIPAFDTLTVESGMCLVLEDLNRAGCGGGLPRIAYSRNWALESVISPPRTYKTREVDIFTMAADAHRVLETWVGREGRLYMRWRN